MAAMNDLVPLGRPKAKHNALGGFGAHRTGTVKPKEESKPPPQLPPLQQLGPACERCGVSKDLYGSQCGHLTLCQACGKALKLEGAPCKQCGEKLDKLVRVRQLTCLEPESNHCGPMQHLVSGVLVMYGSAELSDGE